MPYEIELKFPLPELGDLIPQLVALGARAGETLRQSDHYYNHPQRDFAETNEALRVRTMGTDSRLTYKGPVLSQGTKTREEWEIPLTSGELAGNQLNEVLTKLSFRPVRTVAKERRHYHLHWEGCEFEIALDQVEGLGLYLEIETLAEADGRAVAEAKLLALAQQLNLTTPEPRSYLEMLLTSLG